nr:RecName: Full=Inulin-specific lectin [Xerocomus spadiceus]
CSKGGVGRGYGIG